MNEDPPRVGQVSDAIQSIFTSKLVGVLFACSFGAWALVLQSVSGRVIDSQDATRSEVILLKSQIADLRSSIVDIQLTQAREITSLRERQNGVLKRLDQIDEFHDTRSDAK